jgi:putative sugar O-methyltransferase
VHSLDQLRTTFERVTSVIQCNAALSQASVAGKTSEFWRDVFAERPNFPDLNELMVFRRGGFAYGIGDDRQGSVDRERAYSEQIYRIFSRMVDADLVGRLDESTFGAPLVFKHGGIERSASFWINAATSQRVREFVSRFGKRAPLRVLEIGAGWGACAYQLHSLLEIDSYVIVDLPQNLHISCIYLATTLPQRRLEILDVIGEPVADIPTKSIVGCLPATISRLNAKFDLVLNSFSLQEMSLDTVKTYMDWIEGALSDDGLFISFNSHGKAGARVPSDYGYDKYHLYHWGTFRLGPSGFLNTIPYEVVAGRRRPDSPGYTQFARDGLGGLMQLGLDRDLDNFCHAMVNGTLDATQSLVLEGYARFFSATSDAERRGILAQLQSIDTSPIWPYVRAHLALVEDDKARCANLLEEACRLDLAGFARVRANVLRAGLSKKRGGTGISVEVDGFDPVAAYPEVSAIIETGNVSPMTNQTNRILRRN